jgi:hypothetical protein
MVTCVVRYRGENMVTISWDSLPVECKTTGGTRPRHEELQEVPRGGHEEPQESRDATRGTVRGP